jgi:hypothetical protein
MHEQSAKSGRREESPLNVAGKPGKCHAEAEQAL